MKHKQELIDILMNDAKLQFRYADEVGNTCAIGGMAAAFGWEPRPLIDNGVKPYNSQDVKFILKTSARMVRPLKRAMRHFGLDISQLKAIQKTNDRWSDYRMRHQDLKELVESWEEE